MEHRRTLLGELVAEFAGTMILILLGVGVVAQVVTSEGGLGDHDSIAWAWGLGVTFGVYTAARISGAHLNPAVSVALAVFAGFSWRKVLPYAVAQTLGAFAAALLVRLVYADAIAIVDPDHTIATQGIFSTLPGNGSMDISIIMILTVLKVSWGLIPVIRPITQNPLSFAQEIGFEPQPIARAR